MTTATKPTAVAPLIDAIVKISRGEESAGIAEARRALRSLAAAQSEAIAELLAVVLAGVNARENEGQDFKAEGVVGSAPAVGQASRRRF
jgi:hypothetical protein